MQYCNTIRVQTNKGTIKGELVIPKEAQSIVILPEGHNANHYNFRDEFIAQMIRREKIATLSVNLSDWINKNKDYGEEANIELLTNLLIDITNWVLHDTRTKEFSIGYFGARTFAMATMKASMYCGDYIKAVVLKSGTIDLVKDELEKVNIPTLFIVAEFDYSALELNKKAYQQINGTKELKIIKGATHLFEELGKQGEAAYLTTQWFNKYLIKRNDEL